MAIGKIISNIVAFLKNFSSKDLLFIFLLIVYLLAGFFLSFILSNIATNKDNYRHHEKNLIIELFNILKDSIVIIYVKTLVKTADFAYFSQLKKHNKVWNHGTKILKMQSKKKY